MIVGKSWGVPRDSGATLRASAGLSHDLGPRKLWKATDLNFLPLELKQNLKARGYPHCQRWRLGGGGGREPRTRAVPRLGFCFCDCPS